MKILMTLAAAATLFCSTGALASETVGDPYRTWANVTGQREETRNPALLQCFKDVLVKVSGDQRLLADPRLEGLYDAGSVSSYSYRDLMADVPKHDEQGTRDRPFEMTVDFAPEKINAALRDLDRQAWSPARPKVVVFLAVKIADTVYVLTDSNDAGDLQRKSFRTASRRYGVPIAFPTHKTLQAASIDFESLMNPDVEALNAGAAAAGGDVALAGSLIFSDALSGWIADWRLSSGGKVHHWEIRGVNFDEAFRNAIRGTAQILSSNGEPN